MTSTKKSVAGGAEFWRTHGSDAALRAITNRYERARAEPTKHWSVNESKLALVARMSATAIVRKSPHFRFAPYGPLGRLDPDSYDRLSALLGRFDTLAMGELDRARALADFCVLATLLDFDCGPSWRMRTRTGALLGSDTGTLVAAYGLFVNGALSNAREADPLRVDADALSSIDRAKLDVAFAAAEGEAARGLDDCVARLRNVVANIPADESGARRLGGSMIDGARAPVRNQTPTVIPYAVLFRESVRALMGAFDDRAKASSDRAFTAADVRYASLALALATVVTRAGLLVANVDEAICPPDRWSVSLLLDTGVIAASRGRALDALIAERDAVEELLALASVALDAVVWQVRSLTKTTEEKLPKAAILAWGTSAAGRAISARERRENGPVFW